MRMWMIMVCGSTLLRAMCRSITTSSMIGTTPQNGNHWWRSCRPCDMLQEPHTAAYPDSTVWDTSTSGYMPETRAMPSRRVCVI